jgi:hypothetical protein
VGTVRTGLAPVFGLGWMARPRLWSHISSPCDQGPPLLGLSPRTPVVIIPPQYLWNPPQAPAKPGGASIDSSLALNELTQGVRILLHHRVPHDPRPLAPSPLVGLGRVGSATNDGGEWVFPTRHCQPLQAQRPASSVGLPPVRCPPRKQSVHGGQVPINRVAVTAGLANDPGNADPL